MKRLTCVFVALALMLALLPTTVFAHTEEDPMVVDLLAGQTIDIGDVKVWNDTDNLYVQFVSDICMIETHLHVATNWVDIPQKNGNPIPGKFDYSQFHGCSFDYTYVIPLGDWGLDQQLYIAAHVASGNQETMLIFSDGESNTSVTAGNVPLASYPYLAVDAWEAFNDPPDTTPSYWEQQLTYSGSPFAFSPEADWVWEDYRVVDPTVTQDVTFEHAFTVPGYPMGGKLHIATDNTYSASLNGSFVGAQSNWQTWQLVGAYDIFPSEGNNVLQVVGSNYGVPNYNQDNNPAGLIYEAEITYIASGETAWGDGEDFPGKNWATYFGYIVQGEVEKSYPETGNAYIGYEDWPNGDFDYNDFGMYFSSTETYWGITDELYLTKVTMTFTAIVYDSGMDHQIHIKRPIAGGYTYTVTRGGSAYTGETPAGIYTGSGDVDVVLFNTAKYPWPAKKIGETVTVEIVIEEPALNPKTDLLAPRWDLDPFMANYDPWEVGTLYGSLFHIEDMQNVTAMSGGRGRLDTRLIGQTLPYILVVPDTDWIPPFEDTCISGPAPYGPYQYFYDYYNSGGSSHPTWYTEITNITIDWGGLSWAPAP